MTVTAKPNNLVHLYRDTGYRFTGDGRDPVLDEVTRAITNSGLGLKTIEDRCGVTRGCMSAWQNGKTRRPQNATVEMVFRTLGYHRVLIGPDGNVVEPKRRR